MSDSRMGHLALHFGVLWAFLGVFRAQNGNFETIWQGSFKIDFFQLE